MSADGSTDNSETTTTLAPETEKSQTSGAPSGDGCANCGSTDDWGHSSWCPRCGWYPALNTCVEVDPVEEDVDENAPPPQWWQVIPLWGWVLGAGIVGLVSLSVFARVTTSVQNGDRGVWTLIQLTLGVCAFGAGQIWAYLHAVMKSSDFGPMDIITQPIAIWSPSTRQLPKSFPRLVLAIWGLTAAFLAVAVIGGVRYSAVFDDWGFEKQATPNLMSEITKMARENEEEGADSLEGAIDDFAGKGEEIVEEEPVPEDLVELDCLIIGYTGESEEKFSGLVLAALIRGKLQYVGTVYEGVSPEVRAGLAAEMKSLGRDRSFVRTKTSARWLKPKLMCRVTSSPLKKGKLLVNPVFKERLTDTN